LLPWDMRQVVENLQRVYNTRLTVICDGSVRPEWLQIKVSGFTERQLLHDIERKATEIFGEKLSRFRIMNYLGRTDVQKYPGVWIHYIELEEVSKEPSGFWYA
jgi:hypothetical protein